MVASTKVLDALKGMGLNLYERKLYVALLSRGVATAGELSELANVPRSRAYDILESLAEKGFVVPQPGRPIKYVALAPRDAFERHKEILKRNLEEALERVDRIAVSDVMNELENIYENGLNLIQPYDMTGTIKGKENIHQHIAMLFKTAEKEVNIIAGDVMLEELYTKHLRTLRKLVRRGVKIKVLAPETERIPIKTIKDIVEFRGIKKPIANMIAIDKKHVILTLTDPKKVHHSQNVAFWAQSQHLAENLIEHLLNSL